MTGAAEPWPGGFVRPFLLTGGRTVGPVEVADDDVVRAAPAAWRVRVGPHARRVVEACREPHPVASLVPVLDLPLGVVRVLVADLLAADALELLPSTGQAERRGGSADRRPAGSAGR